MVDNFTYDGSDHYEMIPIYQCDTNAAYIDLASDWVGYDLTEEEQRETIQCPHCKQFPFKCGEVQVHEIVRAVMFWQEDEQ